MFIFVTCVFLITKFNISLDSKALLSGLLSQPNKIKEHVYTIMGKPKFSLEEGKRIIEFIQNWRKKNPDAVEWPLGDIQEKLQVIVGLLQNSHALLVLRKTNLTFYLTIR